MFQIEGNNGAAVVRRPGRGVYDRTLRHITADLVRAVRHDALAGELLRRLPAETTLAVVLPAEDRVELAESGVTYFMEEAAISMALNVVGRHHRALAE